MAGFNADNVAGIIQTASFGIPFVGAFVGAGVQAYREFTKDPTKGHHAAPLTKLDVQQLLDAQKNVIDNAIWSEFGDDRRAKLVDAYDQLMIQMPRSRARDAKTNLDGTHAITDPANRATQSDIDEWKSELQDFWAFAVGSDHSLTDSVNWIALPSQKTHKFATIDFFALIGAALIGYCKLAQRWELQIQVAQYQLDEAAYSNNPTVIARTKEYQNALVLWKLNKEKGVRPVLKIPAEITIPVAPSKALTYHDQYADNLALYFDKIISNSAVPALRKLWDDRQKRLDQVRSKIVVSTLEVNDVSHHWQVDTDSGHNYPKTIQSAQVHENLSIAQRGVKLLAIMNDKKYAPLKGLTIQDLQKKEAILKGWKNDSATLKKIRSQV